MSLPTHQDNSWGFCFYVLPTEAHVTQTLLAVPRLWNPSHLGTSWDRSCSVSQVLYRSVILPSIWHELVCFVLAGGVLYCTCYLFHLDSFCYCFLVVLGTEML